MDDEGANPSLMSDIHSVFRKLFFKEKFLPIRKLPKKASNE
jgi:hypothetical protein